MNQGAKQVLNAWRTREKGGGKCFEGRADGGEKKKNRRERGFMGFTRWPLTFRSQQDGVVINCRSLRARTLFGPHFKRALRLCLLAGSGVADRPGYGPIASSFPHIWRAAPWRKMRLCVSWCFHMTSLLALQPIRTPPSYFCCLFLSHREA